jgi:DNA-binding beta-propeller fold protein YncE
MPTMSLSPPPRLRRLPAPAALVLALAMLLALALCASRPSAALAEDCPGAAPACPYTSTAQVGQRTGGVLRFPQAVAVGPDGSVYVGDQGSHSIQVFSPDGVFQRDIGVHGTRAGQLTAVGALALAGDGSLLAADGSNRIVRFAPDGTHLNAWGSTGAGIGQFLFGAGRGNDAGAGGGLAASGNVVYVADSGNDRIQRFSIDGGHGAQIVAPGLLANPKGLAVRGTRLLVADDQNHRLVVTDTGGRVLKNVGAGGTRPGELNFPYGVAADPAGRVFVADNMNHRVVRFSGAPEYPYKGRWGSYGTGPGQLAYPRGLAVDAQGQVYVTNTGNDRIEVFDRGGRYVRSFGTSGRGSGQFNAPTGVAADAQGFRAVTDAVNGRLVLLAPDGSVVTSWGSPAPGPTILPRPVGVVFDAAGNAYALDQRRPKIVVFDRASGLPARTIASPGSGPGQLASPSALSIDGAGNLYVADTGNERIVRMAPDGTNLGSITGTGALRGIAVTPDGNRIYAADSRNHIKVYAPDGAVLADFAGTGNKLGKLISPGQITLDGAGNLWVADRGNNRVQQFGPEGQRLQTFGTRGTGPGQFIHPTGVSVDCNGMLTVTDSDNNRVQQFTLAAAPPASCVALAPLGSPPPPKLPTLPEPDGPQVSLRVLRASNVLNTRNIPLRVGCDTGCSVEVSVALTPRAKPPKGRRAVSLVLRAKGELAAGDSMILRPRLSDAQARTLRKALRGRRGLTANVQATAKADVGAPTTVVQRLTPTA